MEDKKVSILLFLFFKKMLIYLLIYFPYSELLKYTALWIPVIKKASRR